MPARYFTPAEVNALLPTIEQLMGELLERRDRVVHLGQSLGNVIGPDLSDVGNVNASQLVQEFASIEQLIAKITDYGCEIKDLNGGLVDFLARRNGRDVYLCWRYGEPCKIEFYHDLHTGFAGRRPVNAHDFSTNPQYDDDER